MRARRSRALPRALLSRFRAEATSERALPAAALATHEINADRADIRLRVRVVREPEEQARLADAAVADQEQFEQVVTARAEPTVSLGAAAQTRAPRGRGVAGAPWRGVRDGVRRTTQGSCRRTFTEARPQKFCSATDVLARLTKRPEVR